MGFTQRLKSFFIVPTSLFSFRSPDPNQTIAAGLRRRRPVLLSWFLLSCVAGALADAKRRLAADRTAVDRKIRCLEELIAEERAGRAGDREQTRKRLRAVGLVRREDQELWAREQAEQVRVEEARRAKLGFWKRHFGSRSADEEAEGDKDELKPEDLAALAVAFSSTPSAEPTSSPSSQSSSTPAAPTPASTPALIPTMPSQTPGRLGSGAEPATPERVEFVPAEKRADWAKRNFV